jgi:hypothetical protein
MRLIGWKLTNLFRVSGTKDCLVLKFKYARVELDQKNPNYFQGFCCPNWSSIV